MLNEIPMHDQRPWLGDYIDGVTLETLIRVAMDEDGRDITSEATIPADQVGHAAAHPRSAGVLCGTALLPTIARCFASDILVTPLLADGETLSPGDVIAQFDGPLVRLLAMERVALNFMTMMSGVATLTRQYVDAVAGTDTEITDTRKTWPGLRSLQKYAVACGGGVNHRMGLADAMLIKDNHLAYVAIDQLGPAIDRARAMNPKLVFVEIEVDSLAQCEQALKLPVDIILLDNMDADHVRQAVVLRDAQAPSIKLEASGGVNLETVRALAQAGADRIAIGALTHSAVALDIGLDIA